ncbi:MAG: DoxX family membrane protein [Bacteroidales bacterium]|nr:DoxX family membrane protein [Bacteroidales bacterium]
MISTTFRNRYIPVFLAILRIAIGWHFLYEGLVKIIDPAWSARPFLEGSRWIFGDFFRWMISGDIGMSIVDAANAYGLTLIGLVLILGLFTRLASWSGVALLFMYYLAYPPFGGFSYGFPSEGSYLVVNKNLIELFALIILALTRSGQFFGLDMLLEKKKIISLKKSEIHEESDTRERNQRRELLKGLAGLPFLAAFGGTFVKNLSEAGPDVVSGATIKVDYKQMKDLKGKLPEGKLGNLNISRMIMGCNLIGGWAHARDLIYANTLFKAYNNERKIIETLYLAEQAGINTTFMVTQYYPTLNKYKNIYNGKIQSICQAMLPDKDFFSDINLAIDSGATAIYIQGGEGDRYMKAGKSDMILKAINYIKGQGFIAGLGAHSLETIKVCENTCIPVDFYVKTLHHDKYWSAHPEENREEYSIIGSNSTDHDQFHDNIWDLYPSRTIEYMKGVKKPWFAFKVLAAGAIPPKDGFRFAFENGADFICVGMFDFQVIDDVNTANEILANLNKREREWFS